MSFILSAFTGGAIGTATGNVLQPFLNQATYAINQGLQAEPLQAQQLVEARIRGYINDKEYFSEMSKFGLNKARAEDYLAIAGHLADLQSIIVQFRKGEIAKAKAYDLAKVIGYSKEVFDFTLNATEYLPSPQDIIRFLVREVFTPEVVLKFGQDKEYPTAATAQGARVGIPETIMKQYWSAHWELPSISQVVECLYRFAPDIVADSGEDLKQIGLTPEDVKTDAETVSLLLKTQDVMPYWRGRVLAISFQNLTRIDIRRMIRLGFLNFRQAYVAHRKLGYPKTTAENLTKFSYVTENLTDWKDAIKAGVKTVDQIVAGLKDWNITEQSIIDLVRLKLDPDKNEKLKPYKDKTVSLIIKAFKQKQIDRQTAIQYLTGVNYSEADAKFILEVEAFEEKQIAKTKRTTEKDLSRADILRLYVGGELGKDVTLARLQQIGYSNSEAIELLTIEQIKQRGKVK